MRKILIVLLAAALLCGCTAEHISEDEPREGSYNMISDGTSIRVVEEPSAQEAAYYVPKYMETKYASSALEGEELEAYEEIVRCISEYGESIQYDMDSKIYNDLLNLANIEQLSFAHVSGRKPGGYDMETKRFSVEFSYRFTPEEMSNMNRVSEAAADKIMENITDDMSEYDILKYFHDYLIRNCVSDTEDKYANTIYGTLVNGRALCEGYAKTFSYLCNRAGIENMIVTGMTDVAHMWNMVKVDGNWYHVDVTWDKPGGMLAERCPDMVMYQYFMVTDAVIENDHTIWTVGKEPPHAYSTKENYFVKENLYVTEESGTETAVKTALEGAVKGGLHTAMIKFDTTNLMLSALSRLKEANSGGEPYLNDIIDEVCAEYNVKLNISWTDYYSPYRIIVFVIDYPEQ